jgi:quercetin dioxygenase-like cupin family protein
VDLTGSETATDLRVMSDNIVWNENPVARQKLRLLRDPRDNGGTGFEAEFVVEPRTGREVFPLHYHPTWTEKFEIVRGRARCLIDGKETEGGPGHVFVCPPNTPHWHPWSVSDEEMCFRQIVEANPHNIDGLMTGVQIAYTLNGLARAGKLNAKGEPNLLQTALLIQSVMPHIMVADHPWLVRGLTAVLSPVARAFGYRPSYPEYGEA